MQTQETQVQEDVQTASQPTTEENGLLAVRKASEMKLKGLDKLIDVYMDYFCSQMIATNGVSYNEKLQARKAMKEAVSFALNFGLDVTNATIREQGKYAKEVNGLAGTLVQAMDTRMILMADRMHQQEQLDNNTTVSENNNEQKETENV